MNEIMVSVCVIAYNHEKYIREALDSFLAQKCNFNYEIIVHDDCSKDSTSEIIMEYYKRYPNIVVPFIESENQYSKGKKLIPLFAPKIRGKYVALCEADDFWSDENKLQRQITFLEENPDYSACVHNTDIVDLKTGRIEKINNSDNKDCDIDVYRIIQWEKKYSFHLSSVVLKSELLYNLPEYYHKALVGDYPISLYLSDCGKVRYLNSSMSVYRRNTQGGWTSTNINNYDKEIRLYNGMIHMLQLFNQHTNKKYSKAVEKKVHYYIVEKLIATYRKDKTELSVFDRIQAKSYILYYRIRRFYKKGLRKIAGK